MSKLLFPAFVPDAANVTREDSFRYSNLNHRAYQLYQAITANGDLGSAREQLSLSYRMHLDQLLNSASRCDGKMDNRLWGQAIYRIFSATVPYLDNRKLQEMALHLEPSCASPDRLQSAWLAIINSTAAGDYDTVATQAGKLYADSEGFSPEYRRYLLAMKLIAHFLQGDHRQFSGTMGRHYSATFPSSEPPVPIDIMLRHVGIRAQGTGPTQEGRGNEPGTSHFDAARKQGEFQHQ